MCKVITSPHNYFVTYAMVNLLVLMMVRFCLPPFAALLRKKKQLQNENAKLRMEIEELRQRLLALERQMERERGERKGERGEGEERRKEECLEIGIQTAEM